MKSSLCQLALAVLSLCEGLRAVPVLKPKVELEDILYMAKHLLKDTKQLYHNFEITNSYIFRYMCEVDQSEPCRSAHRVDFAKIVEHWYKKMKYPSEGEHKMDSLPVLNMNAVEMSNIQIHAGLVKLSSELFIYQKHFDWLKKAAHTFRPMSFDYEFHAIHNRIEKLMKRIDILMIRHNMPRVSDPIVPQFPNSTNPWGVIQCGHTIFHHFHLFLDYATRVLLLMKNKW